MSDSKIDKTDSKAEEPVSLLKRIEEHGKRAVGVVGSIASALLVVGVLWDKLSPREQAVAVAALLIFALMAWFTVRAFLDEERKHKLAADEELQDAKDTHRRALRKTNAPVNRELSESLD